MLNIRKLKTLYKENPELFKLIEVSAIKDLEDNSIVLIPAKDWHKIIENEELCSMFIPTSTFSDLTNSGYLGDFGNVLVFTDAFLDIDDPLSTVFVKLEGILVLKSTGYFRTYKGD